MFSVSLSEPKMLTLGAQKLPKASQNHQKYMEMWFSNASLHCIGNRTHFYQRFEGAEHRKLSSRVHETHIFNKITASLRGSILETQSFHK